MKHSLTLLCAALLGGALATAQAAEVSPAAGGAKPASAATVTPAATKPGTGAAPAAGGNGGGLSSNGGNTATQVGPKKPKCPDPANTACPAVKAPVKTGG